MVSIAVIDDDVKYLNEYEKRIPEILKKNNINGELSLVTNSTGQFLKTVNSNLVNMCIIDINLRNGINGMHLAKQLRKNEIQCEIIFMTGLLEYMQQAFEVQAYNFIQKPGWNTLEKNIIQLDSHYKSKSRKKIIDIKVGSKIYYVPLEEIYSIQHISSKSILFCKNANYATYEGLEEIINRLDDLRFKQCHRSIFVNVDYIKALDLKNKKLILENELICEIGPKFYTSLRNQKGWNEFL